MYIDLVDTVMVATSPAHPMYTSAARFDYFSNKLIEANNQYNQSIESLSELVKPCR